MPASLEQLVNLRSHTAELLMAYLQSLKQELAKNPLLGLFERNLDDLRLPLRVVPFAPARDIEELRAREHFRHTGGDSDAPDEPRARVYAPRGAFGQQQERESVRPTPLDELEPKLQMAVIVGDPGSGKTEWLKHLVRRTAVDALARLEQFQAVPDTVTIPIYVRLAELGSVFEQTSPKELREFLADAWCIMPNERVLGDAERFAGVVLKRLCEQFGVKPLLARLIWHRLVGTGAAANGAGAIVCLDGWDEVRLPENKLSEFINCLGAFAKQTKSRLFLSSRIIGYRPELLPVKSSVKDRHCELQLCPFTWADTEQFVRQFFKDEPTLAARLVSELRTKPAVAGMAQNPLLATLLCMAFAPNSSQPPLSLPVRRVELYERVLKGLLGEWDAIRNMVRPDPVLIEAKLRLLEQLAFELFPDQMFSQQQLYEFLWKGSEGYMIKLPDEHPLRVHLRRNECSIEQELQQDGVLVPLGAEHWMFLHLTFQEYLCACAIARRANNGDKSAFKRLVRHNSWDPAWAEVVIMTAGKLKEPEDVRFMLETFSVLPDEVKNPERNDIFCHRLGLALQCLPEIEEPIRTGLADTISQVASRGFNLWFDTYESTLHSLRPIAAGFPALAIVNPPVLNRAASAAPPTRGSQSGVLRFLEVLAESLTREATRGQA